MKTGLSVELMWQGVSRSQVFPEEVQRLLQRAHPVGLLMEGTLLVVNFRLEDWAPLVEDVELMNRFLRLLRNGYGVERLGVQFPVSSERHVAVIRIDTDKGWPRGFQALEPGLEQWSQASGLPAFLAKPNRSEYEKACETAPEIPAGGDLTIHNGNSRTVRCYFGYPAYEPFPPSKGPTLTVEDLHKMLAELKEVRGSDSEVIEITADSDQLVRCGARILPGNRILIQGHVFGFRTLRKEEV